MRQQAMVAHSDANVDGNNMQDNQEEKCLPTEEEQRCDCACMKEEHEAEDGPVEVARLCGAAENLWLMRLYLRVGCGGGVGV